MTTTHKRAMATVRKRKPRGMGHERRGEILAAARQLFVAEGYETVTTRKLAARAGLSQTGLYVYFRSKEEILDALCRETFQRLVDRFSVIANTVKDPLELLRALLRGYVDFGLAHPDEYQLTFMVSSSAPKFTHHKDHRAANDQSGIGIRSFLLFRDQVAKMVEARVLRKVDVTVAAQTMWAAAHGLVALMIARPGYLWADREALVQTTIDTLIAGLQSKTR